MIDDLLEIATSLAERESGKPKQASLRRAVSTAYYALFNALAAMCADELVGWSRPWEAFTPIYRSLEHTVARNLFNRARNQQFYGPEVASFAAVFLELQEAREEADYNPEPFRYRRGDVRRLVGDARIAIQTLRSLEPHTKLLLASHLMQRRKR
ncbi:hypothetical protein [Methylocystis parvus]|uniref:HEPN domain-containing protein n=1 Tax=Methylocystis parvus TaxID=134 RepID=A0A6B8MBM9_9HYPH|nr:hypothetical protein [Methylocystis parvus]QGM98030.1 hypothetical protein F7D14_11445 [Methylocystis parvus]WBK01654.1 hypothetical protein MMG94_08130 [Methylocystis parvus OBBP]